jgi:outer membrane protein assembly factor BamE (lipoprotein component of BamABCDE complex)
VRSVHSTTTFIGVLALGLLTAGCLVTARSKESRTGSYVSAEAFNQLEVGKTTAAEVESTLGPPDSRTAVDDGTMLWRWTYTEVTEGSGYVFLIFGGSNEKKIERSAYVQIRDGVVAKAWRN